MLMTSQPAMVPGGEIPTFCILWYLAFWSTGPPRLGIVEREWGRKPSAAFSVAQCSLQDSAQVPSTSPMRHGPPLLQRHSGHFAMTKGLHPPQAFPSKQEYRLSMFLNSIKSINISLVSRSHLKVAGCESGGILSPFLTFFPFSDSLQDWETCFFSWGGNSL